MIWEELLRLLGTTAFVAVAVTAVQAVSTRKKLGAEAHRTDAETEATQVETARGLVAELRIEAAARRQDVAELVKRVEVLEEEREANRTEISSLRRQIDAMMTDRDEVVEWVIKWRGWFLAGANPPPPPVPRHLRDAVPEWVADDLDRSTDHPIPTTEENP